MRFRYPVAVVSWNDAVEHSDGADSARHSPAIQVTVGWLLQDDSAGVTLAFEYNEDDTGWRGEQFIPRGIIRAIDYVKPRKARVEFD